MNIIETLKLKLTSGNDVPVSRVSLTKEEAEQVIEQLESITPEGCLPIQPLKFDKYGILRFECNPLVDYLLYNGQFNMNHSAVWCAENDIDDKYQEQFAQLIGYSLRGFSELSYVSDETYYRAETFAPKEH
jgi:hypothetical protein